MTTQGIIIIDMLGLCLIALILNLARMQKLHVGYASIWFLATGGLVVIVSLPPLLQAVTDAVGALFPVSALTLIGFVFIFVVLIFFSVKLTALAECQAQLVQTLALKEALVREKQRNKSLASDSGLPPEAPALEAHHNR